MMGRGRLATFPWGEATVLAGVWLGLLAFMVPRMLIKPTAETLGAGTSFTDVGSAVEKAGEVASYADLLLARVAAGNPAPEPPRILGDIVAARLAWGYAILATGLFAGLAVGLSRQGPRGFAKLTGLDRFDFDRLWLPGASVAVVYLGVGLYAQLVDALGWDALQTEPGGLEVTVRDTWALALYGFTTVVSAPLGEEMFYRGLVFGGLSQWGFVPAAFVSSMLFALSHLDAGMLLPFAAAGFVMCWLYWRSGSIWDAIAFHVLFNLLSFTLLLTRV